MNNLQLLSEEELGKLPAQDYSDVDALVARGEYSKSTTQAKELHAQMFEENAESVRQYQWKNQLELTHWDSRFVNILHQNEFLHKLNQVGEQAGFRAAYNTFVRYGMRGINLTKSDGTKRKYLCAANNAYAPEYSIMRFDEHFLPQNEMFRGWRTVLLRLHEQGFASEQQIHSIFGEPTLGPASRRYREEIFLTNNYCAKSDPWAYKETTQCRLTT